MFFRRIARTATTARPAARIGISSRRALVIPTFRPAPWSPITHRSLRHSSSTPHGDPGVDPSIPVRDLTDAEYQDLSDAAMDTMHENIESLCEDFGPETWEVEYSSGVMTLSLPPHGTYVINKQPPNHQIWVSSPISGPSRYSVGTDGGWVHHRKAGVRLGALLDEELTKLLKEENGSEEWTGVRLE